MQTREALREYFNRVSYAVPELFNMAYAICGSRELAEFSLQYTLTEGWLGESHGGMGFREGLRNTVRKVAYEEAVEANKKSPEVTWDGLQEPDSDPVLHALAREDTDTRRLAALRYGCSLSVGRIARLTNSTAGQVRRDLEQLERNVSRRLPAAQRRKVEALLTRAVRRSFAEPSRDMPSMGAIYRSFEAEATENRRSSHLAARIIRWVIAAVVVVLCMLIFWLAAVLIQGPVLEETIEAFAGPASALCHI